MLWLSHIAVLVAGIVLGILFARKNQKKVERGIRAAKETIDEYKFRRG